MKSMETDLTQRALTAFNMAVRAIDDAFEAIDDALLAAQDAPDARSAALATYLNGHHDNELEDARNVFSDALEVLDKALEALGAPPTVKS